MARQSADFPPQLTSELAAEALSAWLGDAPQIQSIQPLPSSGAAQAAEIAFGGESRRVVLKLAEAPHDLEIGAEFARVQFMREATTFPLPQGLYCDLSGTVVPHSYAIYSCLEGAPLAEATWLSERGKEQLDRQIGEAVAALHAHHAKRFGAIGEALPSDATENEEALAWWRWFQQQTRERLEAANAARLLKESTLAGIEKLTEHFRLIFSSRTKPSLIHGNLWSATIIVRPADEPGMAELSGFTDPRGIFAHPELELANLELWQTVGPAFLEAYRAEHALDAGYPRRKFIYWIAILLYYVATTGKAEYVAALENLVAQVGKVGK